MYTEEDYQMAMESLGMSYIKAITLKILPEFNHIIDQVHFGKALREYAHQKIHGPFGVNYII
jgi:hypothetical protein